MGQHLHQGAARVYLERAWPGDAHGGVRRGVLELPQRLLRFASAGQHPAYVLAAGESSASAQPLATRNLVIGAMPDAEFESAEAQLQPGDRLFLFSDGVFEIVTTQGQTWTLEEFLPLLGLLPSLGAGAERTFTVFVAAAERLLQLLNSPEADRAFARTGFLVVPRSP